MAKVQQCVSVFLSVSVLHKPGKPGVDILVYLTASREPAHTCVVERLNKDSDAVLARVLFAALGFPFAHGESHAKAEGWVPVHYVAR
jgi:hypothetical protein